MTDTRNMTLRSLTDYHDPNLPESALVTVPNGLLALLQPTRDAAEGTGAKTNAEYVREFRAQPDNGVIVPLDAATPQPAPDAMRSLAANIQSKLVQLRHYRDHDCQLDHAKTIAEGRIIQLEQVAHWLATEYLAAPVPSPDGATVARDIVTEWLGMFDPPPQIDFQQSELLQGAIASALAIPRTALPVQPGAGERDICPYCDSEMEKDACSACGRERVPPEGYARQPPQSSREG